MTERKLRGGGKDWAAITRRTFLKGGAGLAGATALSGIPGILAAGQAPAYPKGTKLHMLQWMSTVPAGDKVFLGQAAEFGKQMGVEVEIERIGVNDVRTRTAAGIVTNSGPDIILLDMNWPHLFADGLADVSDVAEAIGQEQGGYYECSRVTAIVDGRWLGVPHHVSGQGMAYREDWFKEADIARPPDTWDEFREVGKKLKAMGRPIGQAFGHSENDPNTFCYAVLWGFGGYEVEPDGKTVALNKGGALGAIRYVVALWKDALDESGLSWDDATNNRAFLSGTLSVTLNSPSIYTVAGEKVPDVYKAMNHFLIPKGPAGGRFIQLPTRNAAVMKYSKNQGLAKEFIRWYMAKPQYDAWFQAMNTFAIPPTKIWYNHPLWTKDPKLTMYRDVIRDARCAGYAGPPTRKASEALAKYIVVDMFAKAIQGVAPEESLKWATQELNKIYTG